MWQGEVYWLGLAGAGSEPSGRRPAVVVQDDRFNASRILTTVVAAITSNLALAAAPGNVRLRKGEANLPRRSQCNAPPPALRRAPLSPRSCHEPPGKTTAPSSPV